MSILEIELTPEMEKRLHESDCMRRHCGVVLTQKFTHNRLSSETCRKRNIPLNPLKNDGSM